MACGVLGCRERSETGRAEFEGADAVINLAGRSVNAVAYDADNVCQADHQSRCEITRVVGEAIASASRPHGMAASEHAQRSAGHRYDAAVNDEATGIIGRVSPAAPDTWNFSIGVVALRWGRAALAGNQASTPETPARCYCAQPAS